MDLIPLRNTSARIARRHPGDDLHRRRTEESCPPKMIAAVKIIKLLRTSCLTSMGVTCREKLREIWTQSVSGTQ